MGSTDAKKIRMGSPTGDITLIQEKIPCPVCDTNTASARCARGTCKKCCLEAHYKEEALFKESQQSGAASTNGDSEHAEVAGAEHNGQQEYTPKCEMHLEKIKKEQEKRDKLKAHREAKKARAREIQAEEQSRKAAKKQRQLEHQKRVESKEEGKKTEEREPKKPAQREERERELENGVNGHAA